MPQAMRVLLTVVSLLSAFMPEAFALEFTYAPVDVPGALVTSLSGINNAGQFVGGSQVPAQAFVASGGTFTPLSFPGGASTSVFDINNNGHVVGSYFDGTNPTQGFRYDGTTFIPINSADGRFLQASGTNDPGHVVGTFETTFGQQGFLLHPDGTFSVLTVPGSTFTDAMGINNAGQIVGRFRAAGILEHAFSIAEGSIARLQYPAPFGPMLQALIVPATSWEVSMMGRPSAASTIPTMTFRSLTRNHRSSPKPQVSTMPGTSSARSTVPQGATMVLSQPPCRCRQPFRCSRRALVSSRWR